MLYLLLPAAKTATKQDCTENTQLKQWIKSGERMKRALAKFASAELNKPYPQVPSSLPFSGLEYIPEYGINSLSLIIL